MDHLLIIATEKGVSPSLLQSLKGAGWRVTATSDILAAKQLLQRGDIAGVMVELNGRHDPERLKVLRFVHEFCPSTLVIMLQSSAEVQATTNHSHVLEALDGIEHPERGAEPKVSLDLYRLSPAQKRIASLVAQAYPNREIARRLRIKEQSVRNELSRIFKKMGVWNRVELALLILKTDSSDGQSPRPAWKTEFKPAAENPERNKTMAI